MALGVLKFVLESAAHKFLYVQTFIYILITYLLLLFLEWFCPFGVTNLDVGKSATRCRKRFLYSNYNISSLISLDET